MLESTNCGVSSPITAVVPVKRFEEAKSRLAPVLGRRERAVLALAMAADVLGALRACGRLSRIVVLTADPAAGRLARAYDCEVEPDSQGDLNAQLGRVAYRADLAGRALMVVPADVPCVEPADVATLLDAHRGGVTVCAAGTDAGTNALVCTPAEGLPFLFGPLSSVRHADAARRRGLPARIVELPRLRDIDRPDDLDWLARVGAHTRAWRVLEQARVTRRRVREGHADVA